MTEHHCHMVHHHQRFFSWVKFTLASSEALGPQGLTSHRASRESGYLYGKIVQRVGARPIVADMQVYPDPESLKNPNRN